MRSDGLLSPQGRISADARSNRLWIRDTRQHVDQVIQWIKVVDVPTPHVLIVAHILSVDRNYARELGLQWGTVANKANQAVGSAVRSVAPASFTPGRYQLTSKIPPSTTVCPF